MRLAVFRFRRAGFDISPKDDPIEERIGVQQGVKVHRVDLA